MKVKLECTKDYDLFEMHPCNRPLHENKTLLESMRKHGFNPAFPIRCKPKSNGKLEVLSGHHRLHYAKRLKLEVYYVIDPTDIGLFDAEGSSLQHWSAWDFVNAHAKAGNKNYQFLLKFQKQHGLALGAAASLVGGQSAGSNNKLKDIKRGTFKIGDMKNANQVVKITDLCQELNIPFATSTAFVSATSNMLRVPKFGADIFCHRIKLHPKLMEKRSRTGEYLEEIEALYNYRAKGKRIPLKFQAEEISRERARTFGQNNKRK